jgi:hypothetical protein
MVTKAYEFEFDPYGTNTNNKITKERHTITPVGNGQTNFFIPTKGPFHRRGFVLRNAATQLPLRPGYDYYFGFRFDQMILSGAMQPIYGAIVMNDPQANLIVEIDYQTLGGEFVLDINQITTLLANKQLDPRTVTWAAVVDIPDELPPVPHRHNVDDMVGMNEVVARLYDLIDAQEAGYNKALQALLEHIADHANPHHITLADLGIDDLGNLVPASKEEAETGTDNVKYMTSLRVMDFTNKFIVPMINAHANRTDNPHGTTKAQVGLGSVDNYQTATVVEAQAGVATNRFMTPALTKAAIDVLAPLALASHTGNTNNPHNVTKAQVGLGSVPNYAMATLAEAISGTSTTTFMSPYLVAQAISNGSGQGLSAHLLDFSNPHQVTKDQVGLGNVPNYGVATLQEAIAGTATDKLMTAYLVNQILKATGSDGIAAHIADYNNPHNTTKAQVGLGNVQNYGMAEDADILAMTADDKYVSAADLRIFLNGPVHDMIAAGAEPVTKDSIGLGQVQNYAAASETDVLNGAPDKYMIPSTAGALLDTLLVDGYHLTANTGWVNDIISRAPFEGLLADSTVEGDWTASRLGLVTKGNSTGTPTLAWQFTDNEYDVLPSVLTFTGTFTMRAGIAVYLPLVHYQVDTGSGNMEDNFMAARIRTTGVTEVYLDSQGTLVDAKAEAALSAAAGATLTYSAKITRGVNLQIILKNGATQIFTATYPLTNILTETGLTLTDLAYVFGAGILTPTTDLADVTFKPDNWPSLNFVFTDVVGAKTYSYAKGVWTNVAGFEGPLRKSRFYFNEYTNEVFMALSTERVMLMASPTFGIADSTEIKATSNGYGVSLALTGTVDRDLTVNGDIKYDDGTTA